MVKTCTRCGEEKELTEFYLRASRGTYSSRCKACQRAYMNERYWRDPERMRMEGRQQHVAHREYRLIQGRARYAVARDETNAKRRAERRLNPEVVRAKERESAQRLNRYRRVALRKYGLTVETYEALLISQQGVCAICKGPPNGRGLVFHVDHDHQTNRVRGLLCHYCNTAIGSLGESVELLRAAITYLNKLPP